MPRYVACQPSFAPLRLRDSHDTPRKNEQEADQNQSLAEPAPHHASVFNRHLLHRKRADPVQQPDVVEPRYGRRVIAREILLDGARRKASAVDRDSKLRNRRGLGDATGKRRDVAGQFKMARDCALGVVVAVDQEHPDAGALELDELLAKKKRALRKSARSASKISPPRTMKSTFST
jgi:hypothetical protein